MADAVVVGIISVAGSIIVQLIVSHSKNRENDARMAAHEQEQKDRLDSIEHKLDIHNGYAEKLGSIEKSMIAMQKDIEYLKKTV